MSSPKIDSETVERMESVENSCPVCHDVFEVYAVGPCDHRVCYRCSTRMRVLCKKMDCPICRSTMPQVAFVREKLHFKDISLRDCIPNRQYKIFFEDEEVEDMYLDLVEFNCRLCRNRKQDINFGNLQTHMRKEHQLHPCDLCVKHLKIFPFERKFYTRKNLALHRRVGDPDDTSYKGHPLCEFCDTRYNDKDELLKHLRKDHYFCHFCDQQGSNAYYDQYQDLMNHFSDSHYLCTEGECANSVTRFTHAFNSDIDIKAHKASAHNRNMSKAQSREARTIEVDFQHIPRRHGNRGAGNSSQDFDGARGTGGRGRGNDRYNKRHDRNNEDIQRAIDASLELAVSAPPVEERIPDSVHDFPTLNGAPSTVVSSMPSTTNYHVEDFPTLSSTSAKGSKVHSKPSKAYASIMNVSNDPKPVPAPVIKESKPISLGPVSKVSKERWMARAPKNTEEEYPVLTPSTTSTASIHHSMSSGWMKTTHGTITTHSDVKRPFSTPSVSTSVSHSRKTVKNIADESEFPSLGGADVQRDNVFTSPFLDWSNPQTIKKRAPVVSKKPKVDESFELPNSYYKHFEASSVKVDTSSESGEKITSSKVKSSEISAPPAAASDFPSLPPRTQNDQKGGGEKKKRKNKKIEIKSETSINNKGNKDDSNASLNDIALALVKNGSAERAINNKSSALKKFDWFDDPVVESESIKSSSSPVKTSDKRQMAPPKRDPSPVDNFPSLHAMSVSVQQPKPPPGFETNTAPASTKTPPGFQSKSNDSLASTPPGFSSQSIPTVSCCQPFLSFKSSVYIQPPDFKNRNIQLIKNIRQSLDQVEDGFTNFRALSGQFRQGTLESSDYYYSCQDLMGESDFVEIFPELLALLPDIPKQRQLFEIYETLTSRLSKLAVNSAGLKSKAQWESTQVLLACPTCGQVTLKKDHQYHEHSSDFTSLGDISHKPGMMPAASSTSSVMTATGSWIKAK